MAVTINGNGAVTGLTALPSSAMASKTVIQSKCSPSSNAAQVSSTADSYNDITDIDLLITPKFSNSTMILVTNFHCDTAGANRNASVRLTFNHSGINQTAIDTNSDGYSLQSGADAFNGFGTMIYTHSPNTTNEITYRFQFRSVGSNGIVYFNKKPSKIIAYEVAA